MRLTFMLPGYPWRPVGGYRVVYEYANHLVARGHEVAVVHPSRLPNWAPAPRSLYRRLRRKGAYLRDRLLRPHIEWQAVDPRVRMLYVAQPLAEDVPDADVIFATWWATAEVVLSYPDSKGAKFHLIQHYEVWGGPKQRVDATWRAPLHKVVIAKWLYDVALALGVSPDEIAHIPNGINHKVFHLTEPIEKRAPTIAMLFSELEWKGSAEGVKALEAVKERLPSVQAMLFGVKPRPRWLPRWIRYVADPPQSFLVDQIYNRSSIYLCPSWTEGWHLPPAEAMACGCAVVSTDIGGVRDYCEHERTALLCPPRDPESLAANVVRLLEDDRLRVQLAKAGHERIQQFSWEKSTDLLERFMRQRLETA